MAAGKNAACFSRLHYEIPLRRESSIMEQGSISYWLGQLKTEKNEEAAHQLWQRFYLRLVGSARDRLRGSKRRVADEEDLALVAFNSFFEATQAGRFPKLENRDDLWQLLLMLTERKAVNMIRDEKAHIRGGGLVRGESVFGSNDNGCPQPGLDGWASGDPTPEFIANVTEQCEQLLGLLKDERLRQLVIMKMEGYENSEISQRLAWSLRTVERKLAAVRLLWQDFLKPHSH